MKEQRAGSVVSKDLVGPGSDQRVRWFPEGFTTWTPGHRVKDTREEASRPNRFWGRREGSEIVLWLGGGSTRL